MIRSSLTTVVVTYLLLASSAALAQNTVAITEFINNPGVTDDAREWVELFNFGTATVDLTDWTLTDEDSDEFTFGSVAIESGDYLILASATVASVGGLNDLTPEQAKQVFEEEWLGGTADSRVIGFEGMAIANKPDEIILSDDSDQVVWSLAYLYDEINRLATFHTSNQLWSIDSIYGTKAAPGVDRNGDDNNTLGFLGYENSADGFDEVINPNDDHAFLSDPTNLNSLFGPSGSVFTGPDFTTAVSGFGSPLAGGHQVNQGGNFPPGDFNLDGSVDDIDLGLWEDGYGMPSGAELINGDADGDEDVDGADFLIWQRNFGATGPTSFTGAAVPEPGTLALMLLAGLAAATVYVRKRFG